MKQENKQTITTCNNMDEPLKHNIEQKKPHKGV